MARDVGLPVAAWIGALAVLAGPFYVFESGNPQPADALYLMALFVGVIGFGGKLRLRRDTIGFVAFAIAFVAYIVLVNLLWSGLTGSVGVSKNSLFYLYNITVAVGLIALFSTYGERFLKAFALITVIGLLAQVILSPIGYAPGVYRQQLFYNNPNQLGLYAILTGSVLFGASLRWKIRPALILVVLAAVVYLALLPVSRATMISLATLLALFSWRYPRYFIPFALAVAVGYFAFIEFSADANFALNRLGDMDAGTGSRGYDRLAKHPYYYFFGAGEGQYTRFDSDLETGELHSSWGTLILSYGIVGFSLYLGMIWQIVRFGKLRWLLPLAPASVYGLTHQGLRFTQYWMLVAFLFCMALLEHSERGTRIEKSGSADV
jgi:hypothetical protein